MPLSKEDVFRKMKQGEVVLLNVLPEEEFEKIHIRGSRNLPLTPDHGAFAQAVEKRYGQKRSFITYGADLTCSAGSDAARVLRAHGFEVEDYPGGAEEWDQVGWPTVGTQTRLALGIPQ